MATVTKPIALDESFKTNESPSRNIADVLAEELKGIADNILPPNASQIAYDNTESGLTATNVQDAIDEVISSQADVIADTMADLTENKTATVTDGVADFETIDGSLVKSLKVAITPSQSGNGTPSPDNIRPIIAWTQEDVTVVGKNYFDTSLLPVTDFGITIEVTSNGGIRIHGTPNYSSGYKSFTVGGRVTSLIGKTCTLSVNQKKVGIGWTVGSGALNLAMADTVNKRTGTITTIGDNCKINISYEVGTIDETYYPQLEVGSAVTTFEPYKGKTYTIAFGQNIYWATLDVLTGELTIIGEGVDLGSLTYTLDTNVARFYANVSDIKNASTRTLPLVCSSYQTISDGRAVADVPDYSVYNSPARIFIHDSRYSDATAFKSAVTGQTLVYPLETSQTVQLTPQKVKALVGENHISASTGDVLECKFSMLINGDDVLALIGE